jgi:hypothetical protein
VGARRFVLVLATTAPDQTHCAPLAAARLIWLLPPIWAGSLSSYAGRPAVVVETPEHLLVDDVVAASEAAFNDQAMRNWELAECVALPAAVEHREHPDWSDQE